MQCVSYVRRKNPKGGANAPFIDHPCGQCGQCMTNKRNEWTMRLKMEQSTSDSTLFVTLTYQDSEIPYSLQSVETLNPTHLKNFIKRVRKNQDTNKKLHKEWKNLAKRPLKKIRYFAVGEYGTTYQRPHYHIIFYNVYKQTQDNLQELWKDPGTKNYYGTIDIKDANQGGLHYVTKYHINKHSDAKDPKNKFRHPPFTRMSRMPALGTEAILNKQNWVHDHGSTTIKLNNANYPLPPVFRDKIWPSEHMQIDLKQKAMQKAKTAKRIQWDRLRKKGFEDPERELEKRDNNQSEQLIKNAKKGNQL